MLGLGGDCGWWAVGGGWRNLIVCVERILHVKELVH